MKSSRGEVVAIIPARGGSKGIPRKNIQQVGGLPLIARAVQSALACPSIDRVVVTTDDDEIALIATAYGAEIIERPPALSSDEASSEAAILHALQSLKRRRVDVRIIAFLQPTSPFIASDDLELAVEMVEAEYDVVFSALETHAFLWRFGSRGAEGVNHDDSYRPRRQDRQPQFQETGAFYVMRTQGFLRREFRFFGRVGMVLVNEWDALEIDTPEQLELADLLVSARATRTRSIERGEGSDIYAVVTDFDGVGVRLLREAQIPVLILSGETNPVVQAKADKLGVDAIHGTSDKAEAVVNWARVNGVDLDSVAYLGNDVNDLGCLKIVGWPVAVADAHPAVILASRIVLTRSGGDGAVRELAEHVLTGRKVRPT
jgi:YrbI family 3-deoxy-D-manno-octulosonate 8-phosphate phosphatase